MNSLKKKENEAICATNRFVKLTGEEQREKTTDHYAQKKLCRGGGQQWSEGRVFFYEKFNV